MAGTLTFVYFFRWFALFVFCLGSLGYAYSSFQLEIFLLVFCLEVIFVVYKIFRLIISWKVFLFSLSMIDNFWEI